MEQLKVHYVDFDFQSRKIGLEMSAAESILNLNLTEVFGRQWIRFINRWPVSCGICSEGNKFLDGIYFIISSWELIFNLFRFEKSLSELILFEIVPLGTKNVQEQISHDTGCKCRD